MRGEINDKDIIAALANELSECGLAANRAEDMFMFLFDLLNTALVCEDRIEVRGFGSFIAKRRENRMLNNPKNNTISTIPSRRVVYFRASKSLLEAINDSFLK